jgi:hypothetical protein
MKFDIFHRIELMGISSWIVEELEKAYAAISSTWNVEHNDDGSHADVRADSYTERGRAFPLGFWIDPPFVAADFIADSGTWTVAAADTDIRYSVIGDMLFIAFDMRFTNVSATPNLLMMKLPGNLKAEAITISNVAMANDAGAAVREAIRCFPSADDRYLAFQKFSGNWTTTAANDTRITGQTTLSIKLIEE